LDYDAATKRRNGNGYGCGLRDGWREIAKEVQFDKSQCTNATSQDCNPLQLKSNSDYDEFSMVSAISPNLEETMKNYPSGSFHDSMFDSLSQYEDKRPAAQAVINKLLSLQTLFKEMKQLIKMEQNRQLRRDLSKVENELLAMER
jgi:hypothetical protein